uniref:Small ribosomal subunit protein mS41 SAM domain-containing protein n=1 Tax=Kalanchoe fedtschenkoi TaxID=63787 RepID=A0A7N0ZZ45_KALFE
MVVRHRTIMMSWRQMLLSRSTQGSAAPHLATGFRRFYSKSSPSLVKIGIPEFLYSIGKGVEAHVAKIETEIGDFQKLLESRTMKLKKLGIPCKQRKLILKYSHKYKLGLWRPRAEPGKARTTY